jgi:modulator of FtsH protease HflK
VDMHSEHQHGPAGGQPLPAARLPQNLPPEPVSDPAHESLVRALRSSFNILRLILILLVVAYFASGTFQVHSGEQGLIVRLGRLTDGPGGGPVYAPGFYFAWPDPFDQKIRLPGTARELRVNTFVFKKAEDERDKPLSELESYGRSLKPGVDGAMITGDKNLAHGRFRIVYHIQDAASLAQNVGEALDQELDPLLERLAESAIIRAAAHRRVEEVTREAIGELTKEIQDLLMADLNRLSTGIVVDNVLAETIEPLPVREAFLRATAARNEMESERSKAEQTASQKLNEVAGPEYTKLVTAIQDYSQAQVTHGEQAKLDTLLGVIDQHLEIAQGQVSVTLREARSEANATRERIEREFQEFVSFADAYHKYPELALMRRWVEMRTTILASKQNELFFVPQIGQVLEISTNRDPNRLIEAERQRFLNKDNPQAPRR